jgi:amino acid transporter
MSESDKAGLRRELSRWDTVMFLISAMVVLDTIGAIAIGGGQALTWMLVLFVLFFVPSALITAELGAAIPEEGGVYVWVRQAFGRFAGGLTSMLYWAGTPWWLGGSVVIVAISVYQQFVGELSGPELYAFGCGFVVLATVVALLPLRIGKWVPNTGAISQVALLIFFTGTVVAYGIRHGVHGISVSDLAPTPAVFIAVVPVLIYSFVGVELPTTAAEEMRNPRRDIPVAIARAGVAQVLMYGIPILAVLVVIPNERISSLHGLVDAMKTVFTVYGGDVAADGSVTLTGAGAVAGWAAGLVFIWVLLASGATWLMGGSRAQAAACLDGAGPVSLGRISPRTGTPVRMVLITGGFSLAAVLLNLTVTGGNAQKFFSAALTVSIALIVLAYLMIFPAFVRLRSARPDLTRPFLAPGGRFGAWLYSGLSTGWSALAAVFLLWPGLGMPNPDEHLPAGFAGARGEFELLVLAPILGVIGLYAVVHQCTRGRPVVVAPTLNPPLEIEPSQLTV